MNLLRLLQEGGIGAWAALALGVIGTIAGVVSLGAALGRTRAAFGLGVTTLLLSVLAAAAGIGGTLWGHVQMERALVHIDPVMRERLTQVGTAEAAGASLVGCFAALLPLVLGAFAALVGAKTASAPTRRQGLEQVTSTDERSGRVVLGLVFVGVAALGVAGAWVMAQRPAPPGRYGFAVDDSAAWDLAAAMDGVTARRFGSCRQLERGLAGFFDASTWPRKPLRPVPPTLAGWKEKADECVTLVLAARTAPPEPQVDEGRDAWTLETSALLHDEALRAKVLAPPPVAEPGAEPTTDAPPGAGLEREALARVVKGARKAIQACYERVLVRNPKARGKVTVQFTVGAEGRVTSAEDASAAPFPDAAMPGCLVTVVKALRFPAPRDGQAVTVSYPFVFAPAD